MPDDLTTRRIVNQLIGSSTSVAANYRAACRGRSRPEFIAKLGIVVEEADETVFWLELIAAVPLSESADVEPLLNESRELLAIFAASQITAKLNLKNDRHRP